MLIPWLVGCAPSPFETCPSFTETRVTSSGGWSTDSWTWDPVVVREEDIASVWEAIDAMAAYTGRDGVCVTEVHIVNRMGVTPQEYANNRIEVRGGSGVRGATSHGLCHALDHADGGLSLANRNVFFAGPEGELESDAVVGEVFADSCDHGPRSPFLLEALEEICEVDLGSERQRFLNTEVFSKWTDSGVRPTGTIPVSLDRKEVTDVDRATALPVVGGRHLYLVSEDTGSPQLLRLDVDTAQVTARFPVPSFTALIGGNDGPLLVVPDFGTYAWQLLGEEKVPRAFPDVEWVGGGGVIDGVAWVVARFRRKEAQFMRVDLTTGDTRTIDLPEGLNLWSTPRIGPHGLGGGTSRTDTDEPVWLGYDTTDETWTITPLPLGGNVGDAIDLGDGRLLGTWMDTLSVPNPYELNSIAVVGQDGEWWLADQPCDLDGLSLAHDLLWVGGRVVLFEYANGWSADGPWAGRGHAITRVSLD